MTSPETTRGTGRCRSCRYDLRGIDSPFCPECGWPARWRTYRFFDPLEFKRAVHALSGHEIRMNYTDAGLGPAGVADMIAGGGPRVHEMEIAYVDRDRAREILDREGIAIQVPLVDRAEPQCPACGVDIESRDDEPDAAGECTTCLAEFQWIDSGDLDRFDSETAAPTSRRRRGNPAMVFFCITFAVLALSPFIWAVFSLNGVMRLAVTLTAWITCTVLYLLMFATKRDGMTS